MNGSGTPFAHPAFELPPLSGEGDDGSARGYRPIAAYGLIGDCHGSALVAWDGSIDWCCLDRLDADPVFARLLDRERGGFFEIRPCAGATVRRRYVGDTCLLETLFTTPDGVLRLTDFMPVALCPGAPEGEFTQLHNPARLVRIAEVTEGRVRVRATYRPMGSGFRTAPVPMRAGDGGVAAEGLPPLFTDMRLECRDGAAVGAVEMAAGETRSFVLGPAAALPPDGVAEAADRLREETAEFWTVWSAHTSYDGPHREHVLRSGIVLKALAFAPTGAIVAAPTTSLPEGIGTPRTWDYRFCWLRDASLTLFSLAKLNHASEARRFFEFLMSVCGKTGARILPLYGIDGAVDPGERCHDHLDGYRGSRPVRSGNGAVDQHQMDVYGQAIDLAHLFERLGGRLCEQTRKQVEQFAACIVEHWRKPDSGIWEPRRPDRRHVHSAILSWVGMDRAIRMFGDRPEWVRTRDDILRDIRENGVHPTGGYLTQVFGGEDADSATLVAAGYGLPIGDDVLDRTVRKVRADLGNGALIHRYRNDDGLEGEEGAFLLCSFWLVDALLALDRGEEARALLDDLLGRANDLGLYPEQMEADGTFLGNFPQAFTHLGVIHSVMTLHLYDQEGVSAVRGGHADRAFRIVGRNDRFRSVWTREPGGEPGGESGDA
ncbi:glycoside hydrolase family 15 protein [Roseomonas genomospecies 6]|uniref:Glycoside hydrolase family 15 protein n=1 Tax=Roseomonas genomospecies 6 TaxID=214106 RepID=A0A9W7KRU2_9PROT|nr:glycoside hydrolase family 15 protein [Roseomonas genomospecies 6]KAA0677928.1 glycoside hydrolase family 15 protein [Roseomonas genomospecies 6]